MNNQLVAGIIRRVGREIMVKRGVRFIPVSYLPYIRTALVLYEVVMIGRKIYLSIPKKEHMPVNPEELVTEPG